MDPMIAQALWYCFILGIIGGIGVYIFVYIVFARVKYYKDGSPMIGKIILITGGDEGVGYETALDMCKRYAKVIIASDNPSRGENVVRKFIDQTGNQNIYYHFLDLTDRKSVVALANHITEHEKRLDVLINAAELIVSREPKYRTRPTPNRPDDVFIHNHLGHFLLTYLLINTLKMTSPSRILNVASTIHGATGSGDPFLGLDDPEKRNGILRGHKISKLATVFHIKELARKLAGTDVTASIVHTGAIGETLLLPVKEYVPDWLLVPVRWFIRPVTLDYRAGAQSVIYCAVDKSLEHITGQFYHDCRGMKISTKSKAADLYAEMLWDISLEMCELPCASAGSDTALFSNQDEVTIHSKSNGTLPSKIG